MPTGLTPRIDSIDLEIDRIDLEINPILINIYSSHYGNVSTGLTSTSGVCYHASSKTAIVVGSGNASMPAATATGALTSWTSRYVTASTFRAVNTSDGGSPSVYGVLVTVGDTGKIYSSGDAGSSWSGNTSSTTETLYDVIYSSRLGMWLAVGNNGVIRTCSVATPGTSPSNWLTQTAPEANSWQSIAESPTRLIAVSNSGTNQAMTSTNGTTWSSVSIPSASWASVAYSPYLGLFVAVNTSGSIYSADGLTWLSGNGGGGNGISWIPQLNMFFGSNRFSFDGINWLDYIVSGGISRSAYAYHCGRVVSATWSLNIGLRGNF